MIALALALAAGSVPKVLSRDFYITDAATGEERRTRSVPYRPGVICYNWRVRVVPEARIGEFEEVFTLPATAKWNADEASRVASDGRSATTALADDLSDGEIAGGWCVADGDPPGAYRIRVRSGTTVLATFDFVMEADPASI